MPDPRAPIVDKKTGGQPISLLVTHLRDRSFRATGMTVYFKNSGILEKKAQIANDANNRSTQLQDCLREDVGLDAVERIRVV